MSDKIILKSFWQIKDNNIELSYKKYFLKLFEDIIEFYDQIIIYSVFGQIPTKYEIKNENILLVQLSCEYYFNDPELFNINLIPSKYNSYPLSIPHTRFSFHLNITSNKWNWSTLLSQNRNYNNDIENKTKFCSFTVSNSRPQERINFFKLLSKYKKVDSCGKYNNNIDEPTPDDIDEFYNFMSKYKFTICFENSRVDYYFTEKLLNAYNSKTIPIYWGCPQLPDFINMKAIVYIDEFTEKNIYKAIDRVIELNEDPEKYKEVYEQPLFIDSKIPEFMSINYVKNKINNYSIKTCKLKLATEYLTKIFVINLERRPDRYEKFVKNVNEHGFDNKEITRINAVDGKNIKYKDYSNILDKNKNIQNNLYVLACHLSHRKIWKQVMDDDKVKNDDIVLVFEDDVFFTDNFKERFNMVLKNFKKIEGDKILYIGGKFLKNYTYKKDDITQYFLKINDNLYNKKEYINSSYKYERTTHSYVLNKGLCRLLYQESLKKIESILAVDHFIIITIKEKSSNNIYDCLPHICYSPFNYETDIQFNKFKIPKNIFQTWEMKGDKISKKMYNIMNSWTKLNSDYQYYLYDSVDRDNFSKSNFPKKVYDAYSRILPGSYKVDLWKYCILYIYGGIYTDITNFCFENIRNLIIFDIDFVCSIDPKGRHNLNNSFIMSLPNSKILENCINIIVYQIDNNIIPNSIEDFTGSGVLGRALNAYLNRNEYSSFCNEECLINSKIILMKIEKDSWYFTDLYNNILLQNKNGNELIMDTYNKEIEKIPNYIPCNRDKILQTKIAIYNGFPFHYEMFGYIIEYCISRNIILDIYTETSNNMNWLKFYLVTFPKNSFKLKKLEQYNPVNDYNKVILLTDDDPTFKNEWIDNSKVICIDHSHENRNKKGISHVGTRPFENRPLLDWIIPVYELINIEQKKLLSKNNVVIIGNINTQFIHSIFKNPKYYNYNFILIDRYLDTDKYGNYKNFKHYKNLDTNEMIKILKESHYVFIKNHKKYVHEGISASIPLALNCLCTLIIPKEINNFYKFKSVIEYEDESIINLREPDYSLVLEDLRWNIEHKNKIFDKYIYPKKYKIFEGNKDDLDVYIFSWRKVLENSLSIYDEIKNVFKNVKFVWSDDVLDDIILKKINKSNILHLNSNSYYGDQFISAIKDSDEKNITGLIVGDIIINITDWKLVRDNMYEAFKNWNVGIYAPYETKTCWQKSNGVIKDTQFNITFNTDCTVWFLAPYIKEISKLLPISEICKYGWGIDKVLCRHCIETGLHPVFDRSVEVINPPGSGYNGYKAGLEMGELYKFSEFNNIVQKITDFYYNETPKNHFVTFADSKYVRTLTRILKEAKSFVLFDTIEGYTENTPLMKDFINIHKNFISSNFRGFGYWIWKSYIVLLTFDKIAYNDVVVYTDVGCELNPKGISRLKEYIELALLNDLVVFKLRYKKSEYTKMDLFDFLNCKDIMETNQIMAGVWIIRKTPRTEKFLKSWLNLATENNYHFSDDSPSILPNSENFVEHRHDQSIFSLLIKTELNNRVAIIDNEIDLHEPDFAGGGFYERNGEKYPLPIIAKRLKF